MIARLPQPFVLTDPLHDLLEVQWIWQSNFELALDVEEARRRGVPSVLDVLADDGHDTKGVTSHAVVVVGVDVDRGKPLGNTTGAAGSIQRDIQSSDCMATYAPSTEPALYVMSTVTSPHTLISSFPLRNTVRQLDIVLGSTLTVKVSPSELTLKNALGLQVAE